MVGHGPIQGGLNRISARVDSGKHLVPAKVIGVRESSTIRGRKALVTVRTAQPLTVVVMTLQARDTCASRREDLDAEIVVR
jgi:hypothetical protein